MKDKYLGTILVFVVALVAVFVFYRHLYLLYAAILLGCIGLFIPALARKLHWLWMKFAEGLGFVMNKLILGIIFFLFLVPVAFISRLFRKNPFKSKPLTHGSYYVDRNFTYTKESMENLW